MDFGLLLARLTLGGLMAAHGSQKLFGWFGGYGLTGTAGFFEALGFRPPRAFAAAAGASELAAGVLIAVGLLQPFAAALILAVMIVAAVTVHWGKGLLATGDGIELPLLYAALAVALALTGPGAYSLDAVLGLAAWWTPAFTVGVLALGALGGAMNLALRKPTPGTAAA